MTELRYIINGCSINLKQLTERELFALIDNQTTRAALLASELKLLTAEAHRRTNLRSLLNVVA